MLFLSISSCIEAKCMHNSKIDIKISINKSNCCFTFEFGNPLDFERFVLHFVASIGITVTTQLKHAGTPYGGLE